VAERRFLPEEVAKDLHQSELADVVLEDAAGAWAE